MKKEKNNKYIHGWMLQASFFILWVGMQWNQHTKPNNKLNNKYKVCEGWKWYPKSHASFSSDSHITLGTPMSIRRSTTFVQTQISQQLLVWLPGNVVQTFIIPRGRIPMALSDCLTFSPPTCQSHLSWEVSQHLLNGLVLNFVQTFMALVTMNLNDFGDVP